MDARSWVILDVSLKIHLPVSCQIQKSKPRLEILTENALTVQNLPGWEKERSTTVHLLGRQRRMGRRGSVLCIEQTICIKPCLTGFSYA